MSLLSYSIVIRIKQKGKDLYKLSSAIQWINAFCNLSAGPLFRHPSRLRYSKQSTTLEIKNVSPRSNMSPIGLTDNPLLRLVVWESFAEKTGNWNRWWYCTAVFHFVVFRQSTCADLKYLFKKEIPTVGLCSEDQPTQMLQVRLTFNFQNHLVIIGLYG